jgi:hypothetical protein
MPISYDLRDGAIWFLTVEDVDYDEGFGVLDRAFSDAATRDPETRWDVVFDILGSTENRSADELNAIAEYVAKHDFVLSGRFVLIAADEFHYALARMFAAYSENLGLQASVVRDVPAAVERLAAPSGF